MEKIEPLTLGFIASYYYLEYSSVSMFQENLSEDSKISDLLTILSDASEYNELPVRHNEEKINEVLAQKVRWAVTEGYEDPHVKANILFQCHMQRIALPMTDFYTDTQSLLDQSIRILQALIDISAENGYLHTTLNLMTLTQMIVQGSWETKEPTLLIPRMPKRAEDVLKSKGRIKSLTDLIRANDKERKAFLQRAGCKPQNVHKVTATLDRLPDLEVKYKLPESGSEGNPAPPGSVVPLMLRLKRSRSLSGKAAMQKIGKAKAEGWWVVIGREDIGELVALKRVTCRSMTTVNLDFDAPDEEGVYEFVIHLISDTYRGLDRSRSMEVVIGGREEDDELDEGKFQGSKEST